MVNKDILTNMRNRLAYVNFVTEQNQALRTDSSPSFVFAMLDIDNFKMINDIRGHAEGDNILKLVGAEIMAYFNPLKCQSYRFGGDEFALLFENMPLTDAQAHIDTFCAELYRSKQISLSYGCASVDFRNEKPFETAYKQADMIMYSYKQQKKCST